MTGVTATAVTTEEESKFDDKGRKKLLNPRNALKMGAFHRYTNQGLKKRRVPSLKKRVRDLERLLAKPDLPEDMRTAKRTELKGLKKEVKKGDEAEKFELKYKKIKFFGKFHSFLCIICVEKKKVIKKLEAIEKVLKQAETAELKA